MVVVALLSVDLVESVDLVSVDLVVNCTLLNDIRIQILLGGNREAILAYGKHYDG